MPSTYLKITQALVDRYKAGDSIVGPNTFIRCAAVPGFGVHVQRTKSSYFVEGTAGRAGRNVRVVIGTLGKLPLDKAVAKAKAEIGTLAAGTDPLAIREALQRLEVSAYKIAESMYGTSDAAT